jgi:hypothetical protein
MVAVDRGVNIFDLEDLIYSPSRSIVLLSNPPPPFGQTFSRLVSAQPLQKVQSKEQIIAFLLSASKS